jgi:hypothetical protein
LTYSPWLKPGAYGALKVKGVVQPVQDVVVRCGQAVSEGDLKRRALCIQPIEI